MAEDIASRVAKRLTELREQRGWSMRELARRAGLPPESVSRSERGISEPSITTLARLCDGLGIDLPVFFDFARKPDVVGAATSEDLRRVIDLLSRQTPEQVHRIAEGLHSFFPPQAAVAGLDEKAAVEPAAKSSGKKARRRVP